MKNETENKEIEEQTEEEKEAETEKMAIEEAKEKGSPIDYTVKNKGVEITASEIYCDGSSIYLTTKITTEYGKMDKMPNRAYAIEHNIEQEITESFYTEGTWSLNRNKKKKELRDSTMQRKVLDDHTFIGMLKLDLDEVVNHVDKGEQKKS